MGVNQRLGVKDHRSYYSLMTGKRQEFTTCAFRYFKSKPAQSHLTPQGTFPGNKEEYTSLRYMYQRAQDMTAHHDVVKVLDLLSNQCYYDWVRFKNEAYNYATNINGTDESIRAYFIGAEFNFGDRPSHPRDDVQTCIDVVFLDREDEA